MLQQSCVALGPTRAISWPNKGNILAQEGQYSHERRMSLVVMLFNVCKSAGKPSRATKAVGVMEAGGEETILPPTWFEVHVLYHCGRFVSDVP